ncbi:MAG: hypothetical protein HOP23_18465 [Methylococcaceae bacterium]|nr:hypothetical protein [Methylococcaceae bacterium]
MINKSKKTISYGDEFWAKKFRPTFLQIIYQSIDKYLKQPLEITFLDYFEATISAIN